MPSVPSQSPLHRALPARWGLWAGTAAVLAVGVAFNVAEHLYGLPIWVGPLLALGLVVFARVSGLSWAQLGLSRGRLRSGLAWGGSAILVVAVVYVAGLLLPFTRTL